MSRFNKKSSEKFKENNFAGGEAFKVSAKMDLYMMVCTSVLQPTYYVPNTNDQLNRIKTLISAVNDPVFVAKLAVYAREKMHLRTIPLVLIVELSKQLKGQSNGLIRKTVRRVVQRADEITELLAYYVKANSREGIPVPNKDGSYVGVFKVLNGLSNQIKKGIKDVFESGRFNEYNLAKYNRDTEVKLRDALFLSHPKPKDQAQLDLFNKLANDKLETPYTWEVELSKGDKPKKQVWEELIDSGKVGYMALLRNLRNIIEAPVSTEHIYKVAKIIGNSEQVRKSKQLPFRFLSAYRSLGNDPEDRRNIYERMANREECVSTPSPILRALEQAVNVSIENIPLFKEDERVLTVSDVSGSMITPLSPKSSVMYFDIGLLMSSLIKNRCPNSDIGIFGDRFALIETPEDKGTLSTVNYMYTREGDVGYSTNGYKVIQYCLDNSKQYDRILIFTDCQLWNSDDNRIYGKQVSINKLWKQYNTMYPESKLYLFNMAPYGKTIPVDTRYGNVYLISGWSDQVFNTLYNIENGGTAMDEIEEILL